MPDPIPASRIKGLRLVCRHCAAEAMIPITARDAPAQCFNCYAKFAQGDILNALRELKWLHDVDARPEYGIGLWIDPLP